MGTPLRNVVGAGAEKIVCWLLSKAASAMSLVPFLIIILADGLQSRSYTTNFHRRQGAAASYGAPSRGQPVMASYNNNSPLQQSRPPKSITIPLPDFDIGQIIREKENILGSIVNIKKILLSPVVGIGRQIVDTKLNLVLPLIQPVIGFKRTGLEFLRGLIDEKISLLDNFSSMVGVNYGSPSGSYGSPSQGYGAGRARSRRGGWLVRR